MRKKLRLLSLGGSIMAFHVGSGFASGQEILQFYTAFGPVGGICMGVLAFGLFALFGYILLETGRCTAGRTTKQQYCRLAGSSVGTIFHRITPLLMALVLCVTVAGGGTVLQQLFGLSAFWGRVLIALPVLITVLLGLRWITALAGSIGPVIIVCALCLGGIGILRGRDTMLWSVLSHTSKNWGVSALSYACFGTVTQIPFLLTVGAGLEDPRDSAAVAVFGNGGFMLTGMLLHLGLYRSLPKIFGEQLPLLRLAGRISGLAWWFYGVILLLSVYTTAVPLLWSVCRELDPRENSVWYRLSAVGLTALACFGASLPFDRLLGILYPYIGYVSTVFFVCMTLQTVLRSKMLTKEKSPFAAVRKR